jgi:hypothetical protein
MNVSVLPMDREPGMSQADIGMMLEALVQPYSRQRHGV